MAKKRKLSDLIGEETQQIEKPQSEVTDSVSTKVANSVRFISGNIGCND